MPQQVSVDINKLTTADHCREAYRWMHSADGHTIDLNHRNTIFSIWCFVGRTRIGLGSVKQVYFGLFWTAYADWIYTVVSLSGLLLICWLVLGRPSQR